MAKFKDITGMRSGLLVAQWPCGRVKSNVYWLCLCQCGQLSLVHTGNFGTTVSCGCFKRTCVTTHNLSKTPTYSTWKAMIKRCENKNASNYSYYGGRGIKVCERWRNSFADFLYDMGKKPEGTSIERKDNNGNYE